MKNRLCYRMAVCCANCKFSYYTEDFDFMCQLEPEPNHSREIVPEAVCDCHELEDRDRVMENRQTREI